VPREVLAQLLGTLEDNQPNQSEDKIGIGLDSCVIPLRDKLFLIESTDFFYPLIDDPYLMGKITCANVVSDVYAIGVTQIDSVSMILSVSGKMSDKEKEVVIPMIIKGFQDNLKLAQIPFKINHPIENLWCMIGGTATAVCTSNEFINPINAVPGDVLVLTKPLGCQIASTIKRWSDDPKKWAKVENVITKQQMEVAFADAVKSMARLNKTAAVLMNKYDAHAATDVTGFGILGHAENLAKFQKNNVQFLLDTLPVLKNIFKVAEAIGQLNKFLKGFTPETSGGLLISMKKECAEDFCKSIKEIEGYDAWVIGKVVEGNKDAAIISNPRIIEVLY